MTTTQQQEEPQIIFPHRTNRNGTFDSICPLCYRTIATEQSEYRLAKAELAHRCYVDAEIRAYRA